MGALFHPDAKPGDRQCSNYTPRRLHQKMPRLAGIYLRQTGYASEIKLPSIAAIVTECVMSPTLESRWLDTEAAARYLCLRMDAFARRVRSGAIPEANYSLGARTPRWWSSDLDAVMRSDTASTNTRTAVQALVQKIKTQGGSRRPQSAF